MNFNRPNQEKNIVDLTNLSQWKLQSILSNTETKLLAENKHSNASINTDQREILLEEEI